MLIYANYAVLYLQYFPYMCIVIRLINYELVKLYLFRCKYAILK